MAEELKSTSKILSEHIFWDIVEQSLKNSDNQEDQEVFLIKEIEKLSPEEIIGFRLMTDKLLNDTYNSDMCCACCLMNGRGSDDGFEYFRNWIISRGKDTYLKAKENPDSLISEYQEYNDLYDFEAFWYVALEAFENKTGEELYDYIAEDFEYGEGNYPDFETTWESDKPESMKIICPKLFDKLG